MEMLRKLSFILGHRTFKALDRLASFAAATLFLRLIIAAAVETRVHPLANSVLIVGGISTGYLAGSASWLAFLLLLFPIVGLNQAAFLSGCSAPVNLVFAAIFMGRLVSQTLTGTRRPSGVEPWAQTAMLQASAITADFLTVCIWASSLFMLWIHWHSTQLPSALWTRTEFGFGEECYFLTSALIWIQGLCLFRELCRFAPHIPLWPSQFFKALIPMLVIGFAFQKTTSVPEPLWGFACFLPCEDISSFGSIALAAFAFVTMGYRRNQSSAEKLNVAVTALILAVLIIASWSRATWLSAVLITLTLFGLKTSWKRVLASAAVVLIVVSAINLTSRTSDTAPLSWRQHPYASRLLSLVRFENPVAKDPTRVALYEKAINMIKAKPLLGHGVGSFYHESTKYGRKDDYYEKVPDFAHNALLQSGAEFGLPIASALWILVFLPLGTVLCRWIAMKGTYDHRSEMIAAALVGYLLTQLTANSLNVYPSHQFTFWFLLASLYVSVYRRSEPSERYKPKVLPANPSA